MLGVGRGGMLGDGVFGHSAGEFGVGVRTRSGELAARIGDQQANGGAPHGVRQRRALEGFDDRRDQTHATNTLLKGLPDRCFATTPQGCKSTDILLAYEHDAAADASAAVTGA